MNGHTCVVGGGSEIAKSYIFHRVACGDEMTIVHTISTEVSTSDRLRRTISVKNLSRNADVMVTFCGDTQDARIEQMPLSMFNLVIEATLTSVFKALNEGLPRMNNPGNVVVVGSIVGSTGGFGCANYAAAKAGLVGLVRAAANEWASRGVVVNLLELGYVNAGMGKRLAEGVREKVIKTIPLKRFAEVGEVIQAIDFLGSVRYMTGNVLTLAGGLR